MSGKAPYVRGVDLSQQVSLYLLTATVLLAGAPLVGSALSAVGAGT